MLTPSVHTTPSVIYLNEAFYFAVMSATTVGYGDSVPESPGGKLFISIYLIVGK